jgi:drug/metabolite transporter (DMT)-like permease
MALVILAAFAMAVLLFIFKVFGQRSVPLLPAIVVNYSTAFLLGMAITRPWETGVPSSLVLPSIGLGALFITLFHLTAVSTQRAGLAVTSVATKMSLVLTVLYAVIMFHERPAALGWVGIVLALIAVPISSYAPGSAAARGAWAMPLLLFVGTAAVDITLNTVQRKLLEPETMSLFPTLVFGVAGALGFFVLMFQGKVGELAEPKALIGGVVLGMVNYASLYFIVGALAHSGFASSSVFPLMNIGVILFSTALSMIFFQERLRSMQWAGIVCAVLAMTLILLA